MSRIKLKEATESHLENILTIHTDLIYFEDEIILMNKAFELLGPLVGTTT